MASRTCLLLPFVALTACAAHGASGREAPPPLASTQATSTPAEPVPPPNAAALGEELLQVIEEGKPNSTEEVDRLLRSGAPVNYGSESRTPLNLAAYNNDLAVAQLLVAAGARINVPNRAPQEESTLELAIRTQNGDPLPMVRFLVEHGADVDAETAGAEADPGSSPQLAAIRRCAPELVAFLRSRARKRVVPAPEEICRDQAEASNGDAQRAAVAALLADP